MQAWNWVSIVVDVWHLVGAPHGCAAERASALGLFHTLETVLLLLCSLSSSAGPTRRPLGVSDHGTHSDSRIFRLDFWHEV